MATSTETCLLCGMSLNDGDTVEVTKGLSMLIEASQARGDAVNKSLENVSKVIIHTKCRKNYTRKRDIEAAKSDKQQSTSVANVIPPTVLCLRSDDQKFDFKGQCLFCGQKADILFEKKRSKNERNVVILCATKNIRKTIVDICERRNDDWGETVARRLSTVIDLIAAEGRYHRDCYCKFQKGLTASLLEGQVYFGSRKRGRGVDTYKMQKFQDLCEFLERDDECQYSVSELVAKMKSSAEEDNEDTVYTDKWLKKLLLDKYGENIIITELPGKYNVVTFRGTSEQILCDKWYAERKETKTEERQRIVQTAAKIILEDIRSTAYACDSYCTDLSNSESLIPATLKLLVETIVMTGKKGSMEPYRRKCIMIEHALVTATRPRSFLSPLQVGLAVHLHRHYGSRQLSDMLCNLGVCASYAEAQMYEASVLSGSVSTVDPGGYVQFVFDNADFNVRTLDGKGTFHSMGGIRCVTPQSAVKSDEFIPRLRRPPSAATVAALGKNDIKTYTHHKSGIYSVIVEDVLQHRFADLRCIHSAAKLDILWISSRWLAAPSQPSWSGYMSVAMEGSAEFDRSEVMRLPFINLDPGNLSTIYTSLCFAAEESRKHGQSNCMVTFDQPLYLKAVNIVLAEESGSVLSSVIVRLGGFHLLMSFMGSIGFIMGGSGLEEVWELVYAKSSVVHMLTGHAYARALRAHFLTQLAIATIVLQDLHVEPEELQELQRLQTELLSSEISVQEVIDSVVVDDLLTRVESYMKDAASSSRTSKLWYQYYMQVALIRHFIRSERCGDWNMQLICIRDMLPYFNAAGHIHYAKCAQLYLQQMEKLPSQMSPEEFSKFETKGLFTVRRSNRTWSGIWSDMTIEQVLMRSLKTSGGLTRGRGLTDSSLARWVLAMPVCGQVSDSIEQFAGVYATTSEQHVEMRESRICRDNSDVGKMIAWFQVHSPFQESPKQLISLSTGFVADESITCDNAMECGSAIMMKMVGQNYGNVKYSRKDKVRPLSTMVRGIRVKDDIVDINPQQLFNRIVCIIKSDEELVDCFKYELSPRPTSLFKQFDMRKTTKSDLATLLEKLSPCEAVVDCKTFVLDGGHILHRVIWPRPATYDQVMVVIVQYIHRHYGENVSIVFDGYEQSSSTKSAEQWRRSQRSTSCDIVFDASMTVSTTQEQFLGNSNNKAFLINQLKVHLASAGFTVLQARADADRLIVETALNLSLQSQSVTVVADDTDVLIMLLSLSDPNADQCDVYMLKPGVCNKPSKVYNIRSLREQLNTTTDSMLFLHAVSGCDTTSAIFRKGKKTAFNILNKNKSLQSVVDVFNNPTVTHDEVASAGEDFLKHLYGMKGTDTLDRQRYYMYKRAVCKLPLHSKFDLATLPPTSAAARQHSYRVYLQVQQWRGVELEPTDWGWKNSQFGLTPVPTLQEAAPLKLLELISCNCKRDCSKRCNCRRSGFECTAMCGQCHGESCTNLKAVLEDDTDDEASDQLTGTIDDIDNDIDQHESDDDDEEVEDGDGSDDDDAACY